MGGIFGVVGKQDCVLDVFFGTDYHSHLGTSRGGLAFLNEKGFNRAIHNIENSPFRTKFEGDISQMSGRMGIGCISDMEPQPLIVKSRHGSYAITTVGRINNSRQLADEILSSTGAHFLEMSGGDVNPTELVATLINGCDSIPEGIRLVQERVDGSMTLLILTREGLYAARDKLGRTPLVIGRKEDAFCASFESFAYFNLGYTDYKELGPAEIVHITADAVETVYPSRKDMKICAFLWIYFGYPASAYEGRNVEEVRYRCGELMAGRDHARADLVSGIPDSGVAHAIGYANRSGIPFARPFIKYTPTWPRSFMPQTQGVRDLVARMKIIPVDTLIRGKKLLLIDDSIVRGTQLRETTEFLYHCGAREVHIRPACPPILFKCPYLNFSRVSSALDLITRRIINELEEIRTEDQVYEYADPESEKYACMLAGICEKLNFTSLSYNRLDDVIAAIGLDSTKLCTYCWNGKS
ncbi:MAG: amidophosphoribosyltransferase [Saccharofermentanales bacterium]|nr:amidophosphoribosyltransferase [Clostridiaceae bacterium]